MAMSKRGKVFVLVSVLVPVLFVLALVINWFIYPFSSVKPNFADVEAVYNKMVVPDTWVKKGEGANKGIAGRQCPIESDGCFSKVGTYLVPKNTTEKEIKPIFESMGCVSVSIRRHESLGGPTSIIIDCSPPRGVRASGSLLERGDEWEMYVNVGSR